MTHATLDRPGCTVHYWLAGQEDRPLVVFSHGATMDHTMFDPQVSALLPEYRVLTWDVRGHGQSRPLQEDFTLVDCADDLVAILDDVGVQQAVLAGQSMGGYINQYTYLRYPERVQAMIIIGATGIALPYSRWEILALKATLPLFGLWPYEHFKRTVAKNTAIKPDVQSYALETVNKLSRKEFLQIWKAVTLAVDEKGIPGHHIRVPLLLAHGEHDTTGVIRRDAPKWAAHEPDVHYVVIPDAGHNANQDNPRFFNRVLLEFLRTHVPA
ncbi:MAG TPA: alpha/beta hydrolase [Anaerolineae bacterium]